MPESPLDDAVPFVRAKRAVEQQLADSGMSYVSVRMPPSTEVWLALVGSEIPLRGEPRATVLRPYRLLRSFRGITGRTVERHGVLMPP